jgi:hypothetical protein
VVIYLGIALAMRLTGRRDLAELYRLARRGGAVDRQLVKDGPLP